MDRLIYNSQIMNAKVEGREEGLAEGKAEERLNLLQYSIPRLKSAGLSNELITQSLGLSPEEVSTWLKDS